MPQQLEVMRCSTRERANAGSFETPIESSQHKSPCVSIGILFQGFKLTSLIGTSVPRSRLTSRNTSYMLGRCCGFSLSIHAVQISKNFWTVFDKH